MAEFPEQDSGGLDPLGIPKPKPPMWKRVRAWTIIALLYAIIFGMAYAAIPLLRSAFHPGVASDDRLLHLLWAGFLLLPVGFMARYFVRIRLKTGKWRGTPEQRQQERQERVARCSTVGGKRACAANRNSLLSYVIKWASFAAFQPSSTPWQRTAAWLVLILYALTVLAVAAIAVICFGAAFADGNTLTATVVCIGLGLLALIWPVVVVTRLVRGIRNGKVGSTREELDELRAQRSAWEARENQKPLRNKIIGTSILVAIYAFYWLRVTLHHAQHPHESWVTPAIGTPGLIYLIWVQFRRPGNAPSQSANTN